MREYTVKYQIATYSGEVTVYFDENDDPETEDIIAKAKRQLRHSTGEFPFGYESWKVL